MATGAITFAGTHVVFDGAGFESDVPVGAQFHYVPDDGSPGRSGSMNYADGQVQPGVYSHDDGTVEFVASRRMLITATPGTLTVTVYQDPEAAGEDDAVVVTAHVT